MGIQYHGLRRGRTDFFLEGDGRKLATAAGAKERIGYDVRYRLDGREETVRMDHEPGDRLPVRDGQVVLGGAGRQTAH